MGDYSNPAPEWLSERSWLEILTLSSLPSFAKFARSLTHHIGHYKKYFDSNEPHRYVHSTPVYCDQSECFNHLAVFLHLTVAAIQS